MAAETGGDSPLILVIDDETGSRESMAIAIEKAGLPVRTFDDAREALDFLAENDGVRLAICDLRMPGIDGLGFLAEVRQQSYDLGVILVTAFGSIESAVEAMRVGADDYLTKPVDLYELRKRVSNLLENRRLKEEVVELRQLLDKRYGFESDHRPLGADGAALRADAAGGADAFQRADHRRERHRQGAGGQRPPPHQSASRRALPGDQLRRYTLRHPGERAFRPRARLVHRRGGTQDRQVRARAQGHAVPRRDLRALSRAAGQAAAGARGPADHAGRRSATTFPSTSVSSPPPTAISRRRSPTAVSARTSTTG